MALLLRCCACVVSLLLVLAPARAAGLEGYRFEIVTGDDTGVTRQIADDLSLRLQALLGKAGGARGAHKKTIYVAIGPVALRNRLAHPFDGVLISAYTSSQVCHALLAGVPVGRAAQVTAVFAEPAPADQLRLIALLYKRPLKVAAIISSDTAYLDAGLRAAVMPEGSVLDIARVQPGEDLNAVLARQANTEVLLALPDRAVFNTENIRNILLTTYRHNHAVVGFSADMVNAGALASTYSRIEDINAQIGEIVAELVETGTLATPQFPRYFASVVNEGVARSLGVAVDDTARRFARHPNGGH